MAAQCRRSWSRTGGSPLVAMSSVEVVGDGLRVPGLPVGADEEHAAVGPVVPAACCHRFAHGEVGVEDSDGAWVRAG